MQQVRASSRGRHSHPANHPLPRRLAVREIAEPVVLGDICPLSDHTSHPSNKQFVCCMRVLHKLAVPAARRLHSPRGSWPAMTEATVALSRAVQPAGGMQLASRILHISGNSSNARQKRRNARQKNRGPDDLHCSPCFTVVIIYIFANEYVHQEFNPNCCRGLSECTGRRVARVCCSQGDGREYNNDHR